METINKQTNWINIIVLTKRKLSTNYSIKFCFAQSFCFVILIFVCLGLQMHGLDCDMLALQCEKFLLCGV